MSDKIKQSIILVRKELLKHGELYESFLASIESSLAEHCSMCVGHDSPHVNREVAEKILKRMIGEE